MKKKTVACDVDLTIAPTDVGWLEWLEYFNGFGERFPIPSTNINYDLSTYFPNLNPKLAMDFWKMAETYDSFLLPIEDSVHVLENLSFDHNIVFVSACKGPHYKAKYEWLKSNFPFMNGFVSTKEKYLVKCDFMIDDRLSYLAPFDENTKRILYKTNYAQEVTTWYDVLADNWMSVYDYIRGCYVS